MSGDEMEALVRAAEESLKHRSPWADVRKIAMSPARFDQLKRGVPEATSPACPWAAVEIEVYQICDDRVAVLIDGRGKAIGLYSFERGAAHWFDRKLMDRFMEPKFGFDFVRVHERVSL
jgi:hypothetical protein